ncbi:MAG: hypothetical protein ACAH65_01465 [Chloroflexota bacterium]
MAGPSEALVAVEAVRTPAAPAIEARARPYAPSWLDRLLDTIEALPGPNGLGFLAVFTGFVLLSLFEPWLMGAASPWRLVEKVYWGAVIGAQLAAAGYVRRVAATAFDAFRPALRIPEAEVLQLRYELTVIPALPAAAAVVVALLATAISLAINPAATGSKPLTGTLLAGAFGLQLTITSLMFVLLLQLFRQMGQIRRTLARSAVVDVFRPGPLHAFSRLTSRSSAILLLFIGSTILVLPTSMPGEVFAVYWLPYLVVPPLVAAAAFILPLYGMHGRLVAEKERLQGETEERLQALFAELNGDIDGRELARADGLNKSLMSLLLQRDVLANLPTWPWSPGTLRGFLTAIFLPLVVFLLQQVVGRLI